MSVFVKEGLPAINILRNEMIDIRPKKDDMPYSRLKILILNLMPTKQATENQLIRMLSGKTDIDIEISLMNTVTYASKNTDAEYLEKYYGGFDAYKNEKFDGLIVTGAPVEHLEFEQVIYWDELCRIFDWAYENIPKIYTICWGAQSALWYFYGIKKYMLPQKMFGIFEHTLQNPENPLCKNMPLNFWAPHSRHAEILGKDIESHPSLDLLAVSPQAGLLWAASKDKKLVFMTGHPEYDAETLALEYFRDIEKGHKIEVPQNYFPDNSPAASPPLTWRDTAKIIYKNWLDLM